MKFQLSKEPKFVQDMVKVFEKKRSCKGCEHIGFCNETSRLYGVPKYRGGCKYFEEAEQELDMQEGRV